MHRHDLAHQGQAHAAALALGGIERHEHFFALVLWNAGAVVADGDDGPTRRVLYPQVTNGTFKTDFYFDGTAPTGIHVGQAIDLKVELGGATRAVMLPNGPFYQDTGGNWVFVVAPDGKQAIRRNVKLGRRNPDFVEVVDGLKPGEKAIVSGYEAYQKMDRIEFTSGNSN